VQKACTTNRSHPNFAEAAFWPLLVVVAFLHDAVESGKRNTACGTEWRRRLSKFYGRFLNYLCEVASANDKALLSQGICPTAIMDDYLQPSTLNQGLRRVYA
jgi:hypothetical protein